MPEAAASIIRNVFQFAKILNQAANGDIKKWDLVSVKNAIDWADYCEELFQKLKDQQVEDVFNSHLAQMTMMLQPVSCICLSLDSLRDAKYLLVNTLMGNPELPAQLQAKLRSELSKTNVGDEILCKIQEQALRMKLAEDLQAILLGSPPEGSCVKEGCSHKVSFQADFLLRHLVRVASRAKKKERFKKYCFDLCDKLMQSSEGKNIIVNLFILKKDCFDQGEHAWVDLVLGHLLDWLQDQLLRDPLTSPPLRAEVGDVIVAANTCDRFFTLYLDALFAWADSYQPELGEPGHLTWRSLCGDNYQALTTHFEPLLSTCSPDNRTKIIQLISEKVQTTGFSVWRKLAFHLLLLLKQG